MDNSNYSTPQQHADAELACMKSSAAAQRSCVIANYCKAFMYVMFGVAGMYAMLAAARVVQVFNHLAMLGNVQ